MAIRISLTILIPFIIMTIIVILIIYCVYKRYRASPPVARPAPVTGQPLIIHQTTAVAPPQTNLNDRAYPQPSQQYPPPGGYPQPAGYPQQYPPQQLGYPQQYPPQHTQQTSGYAPPNASVLAEPPPAYSECVSSGYQTQPSAPPAQEDKTAQPPPYGS